MFYLKRKIKKCKVSSISELKGLIIKPRGTKKAIKVKNVLICDKELTNKYIKKQLEKRFTKLYKDLYRFLTSEDDSEAGVKVCLGEIEKTKAAIFNKYKEHMKNKLYKEYLAKIVLTENEFRDKFLQRQYYVNLIKNSYKSYEPTDEMEKGRSR